MTPTFEPLKTLVVDDEAVVRDSLAQWFREDGHEVRTAADGNEALLALREGPWDVALLDIRMPGMDGLEVQRRILAASPDTTIIIMTAYASVQTAVRALKEGAYDYITKPFDPDELSALLRRISEKQKLRRENEELKTMLAEQSGCPPILGQSEPIRKLLERIESVAPTPSSA